MKFQPKNLKKFLKLLKMDELVLQPSKPLKDSNWTIFQWTSSTSFRAFKAEKELLSQTLSISPDSSDATKPLGILSLVGIGAGNHLNTLSLQSKLDPEKKNLVIAHGYGAGLGFFYRNYANLAKLSGYNVFSIDWLGMANSSRPSYPKRHRKMTDDQLVAQSEEFFIEALEKWREKLGIEKMVLAGHSLG
jgi:pimeloyl-ACP methyl ester carboxylesterase